MWRFAGPGKRLQQNRAPRAQGLGFRLEGLGFGAWGLGFKFEGLGY